MAGLTRYTIACTVVEEGSVFTLDQLCRAGGIAPELALALVGHGVLEPLGNDPPAWTFDGPALGRVRVAGRLVRDLDLAPAGVALALELLDEIERLRAALRRGGAG